MRFIRAIIVLSFLWMSTSIYAADTDLYSDSDGDAGDWIPMGPICQVDQVNLEDAQDMYGKMCASCHEYSVKDKKEGIDFTLEGDVCNLETVQAMVDCYWAIDLHDEIKGCDDACVCATSTYIYEILLDGGKDDYDLGGVTATEETSAGSGGGGCFVQILTFH